MNISALVAPESQKKANERVAVTLWPGVCSRLVSKLVSNGTTFRHRQARNGFVDSMPL